MRKRICITGGAGFVGSALCHRLVTMPEYEAVAVDNLDFGRAENLDCGIEFLLEDFKKLSAKWLNEFDVLVHCATVNIIYAMRDPKKTYRVNATNASELFINKFKGKIVNISTSSVYGSAKTIPTSELCEINTTEMYAESKRTAELSLHRRKNFTTLRGTNMYGERQHPNHLYSGVVGKFVGANLSEQPMTINGRGESTRDFVYVQDMVDAIVLAIEHPSLCTELNCGSGVETSISDLCEIISSITGKRNTCNFSPERPIDNITRRCLDSSKAERLLGWKAKTSLAEGIKRTVEWVRGCND